jgi:hypothetical protein
LSLVPIECPLLGAFFLSAFVLPYTPAYPYLTAIE